MPDGMTANRSDDLDAVLPRWRELLAAAREARLNARAPYSQYLVGAAILDDTGRITAGCNVESAAYAATLCAERGAIGAAVAAGAKAIEACLTVTGGAEPASCCGVCRQLLSEFGSTLLVVNATAVGDRVQWGTIGDYLPGAFRLDQ